MRKSAVIPDELREKIKARGNPYAKMQCVPEAAQEEQQLEEKDATSRYIHALEDPYATLSIHGEPTPEQRSEMVASAVSVDTKKANGLSKEQFRAECRRIFLKYIPATDNSRLRAHHRDFISRNEARPPEARYRLLRDLQRYDIPTEPGMTSRFNREDDVFTEEKLKAIEQKVDNGE